MRLQPGDNLLWKCWWPIGGIAVAALLAIGLSMGWSANLWAASGVVAVVYVGAPVTAASLYDLAARRKQEAAVGLPRPAPVSPPDPPEAQAVPVAAPVAEPPPQTADSSISASGKAVSGSSSAAAAPGTRHVAVPLPPAADRGSSEEMLQRRLAALSGRPWRPREQPTGRPWRRVGSAQFADLVYVLSITLPSATQADDTASLSGVTRHLIRRGERDTAFQRWQAVLEQAIDDKADDVVCSEALKLTKSEELRAAVADWAGMPDGP